MISTAPTRRGEVAVLDVPSADADRTASNKVVADGAALGGSAMLTAVAGLLGWLIAARLLPQATIGQTASFVNSFILVASVSELALGPAMLRWLPRSGDRAFTLLVRCYGAAVGTALLVSVVWALLFRRTLGAAMEPWPFWMTMLAFVAASSSWVAFHLQDEALTGLGLARWVPLENGIFASVRIAVLIWLAPRWGGLGIVVSWLAPTVVLVFVVSLLLGRHVRRRDGGAGELPARAEVFRLTAPAYPAQVATAVTGSVVQVMVTSRLGAEMGAMFFVVWTGINCLDVALTGFGNSLVVQLAKGAPDNGRLIRTSARRIFLLLLPVLAVAAVLAPWVLQLFGPGYVGATALMRWVLLGFPFRSVVILVCSIHLAQGRSLRLGLLQGVTAVSLLALVMVAPSLVAFGIGYVIVQAVLAAAAVVDVLSIRRRGLGAR